MTAGVSSSPRQRSFQPEQFFIRLSGTYELVGRVTVPFSSLSHWPGQYFMTVWCHLLGLRRPENNNASQTKDYQSPVLLRKLGIIFKLYSFPQNLRRLNLRTLNINLLSDIKQYPQVGIRRRSTIDILTLKLNVRRFDSCKISKSLGLASLKKSFCKKGQGYQFNIPLSGSG